jgi:uncharacterized protein
MGLMQIYLPIAEISMNLFVLLAMGGAVGFLSGLVGIGGGFLMTPLLIFSGVPTTVAVGTEANQIVATSASGALAQWRRGNVDIKMGLVMLSGGVVGSAAGVETIKMLRQMGQVDLIIAVCYVVFLGSIGTLMLIESVNSWRKAAIGHPSPTRRTGQHNWIHRLPLKQRFHRSKLYISAVPPVAIGAFVGFLAAIMGVGGGFILVPAMIYLLRMPTNVVVGTSLFQILFVAAFTTVLHATQNQTVDVVLAMLLMIGGVIGAQLGVIAGAKLKGEQLRALLALLVLAVAIRLLITLVWPPAELFSLNMGNR